MTKEEEIEYLVNPDGFSRLVSDLTIRKIENPMLEIDLNRLLDKYTRKQIMYFLSDLTNAIGKKQRLPRKIKKKLKKKR